MEPTGAFSVTLSQVEYPEAHGDHNQTHDDHRPDVLPELQSGHTIKKSLASPV
jgi:hypothetical protein